MTRLFALCGRSNVGTRRLMNPYRLWRVKFATVASACGRQLRAQPGIRAKKQLKFVEFGELLALWPRSRSRKHATRPKAVHPGELPD
jgi:hypothetical protein